ncbi:MAG: amidohydrolase family protein [Candidatus Glassbacteria bacterium]|nr:amidohydrolase family protein [Candidatus Glassbacteria bacterium]
MEREPGMTEAELREMLKIDFHDHIDALPAAGEAAFIGKLREHNLKWLTIATVGTQWQGLQQQINVAETLHARYPQQVAWITSFNLENWGETGWESSAVRQVGEGFAAGAVGVKVWKDIGMVLRDPDSSFVMIDDPRFDPVFEYIESRGKTLVAHIGEPRNCWLPLDSMTVNNDRAYFAENPQYHAYLHPEIPYYWEHIRARDRVLEKHPGLRMVGCHLGSLEFDVDELARRFDKYPNFAVDLAARICHLQVQDRDKVRDFCIKYQDRLLYGTDLAVDSTCVGSGMTRALELIEATYSRDYQYFATDDEMEVPEVNGKFHGLALPAAVLKKIFYGNAGKWYPGI